MKTSTIIQGKSKKLQEADKAHEQDLHLKRLRHQIEASFLEMAKTLKEIRDERLYEVLDYKTFESYVAQPELTLDRANVYKLIKIYEIFVEKYNVAPAPLLKAGWDKLARIVPHITDDNYEYYLEKAETLSRSDLTQELVDHHLVTIREQEPQHVECPNCHYVFDPKKRKEESYPREAYNRIIKKYEELKETKFEGKEYDPLMQSIKTMFINGRTPEQIIATMEYLSEQDEYSWTIHTIKNKIAEILPQLDIKPQKEMSEADKKLLRMGGVEI